MHQGRDSEKRKIAFQVIDKERNAKDYLKRASSTCVTLNMRGKNGLKLDIETQPKENGPSEL